MGFPIQASVTITCARGGFVVSYPEHVEGEQYPAIVQEVATTSGKAMRIAKAAVEAFSLVQKTKEEAAE